MSHEPSDAAPAGREPTNQSRTLTPSPFPGDDGTADPQVRQDLGTALSGKPEDYLGAIATLCSSRLLVPVTATATAEAAVHAGGSVDRLLTVDKEADMAVVMLQAADGRRAMLGFTGMDSLGTWDASARPVPVTVDTVARTARQEGAAAVIVDIEGPHPLVLDGEVLDQLAQGHRLVRVDEGFGWLRPEAGGDDPATR